MARKPVNKLPLDLRVLGYIREHHLTADGQTLLVAVSGGQDSVCLLHILHRLQPVLGIHLHVAHLNHQLRGKESAGDARYVAKLAGSLGIPSTIEKRNVLAYQKERGLSLEEAAREVRYNFLAETAAKVGADAVAVAVSGRFDVGSGPISPDHIVYAKSFAFTAAVTPAAVDAFKAERGYAPKVVTVPGKAGISHFIEGR